MKTYEYKTDRRTRYRTIIHLIVIVGLCIVMTGLYEGGYLSAWILSFVAAFLALTAMSIPRRITVSDERLLIRCVLDITEIPRHEIATVRTVGRNGMRWMIPLFGSSGFFGYYGHYWDIRNMRRVEIYASKWDDFIEITTIYEDVYYLSCDRRDELVADLAQPSQQV